MSSTVSSSRGSAGSEEVEVSGRGRGIRTIDLPSVFTTAAEREMLAVVTAFDLSRNELVELTNLQPLRSLSRLNASYNHIQSFSGLPFLLTQLNLAHNKLEHLDQIGQLTHLRELDVSFNRLSSLAGISPRLPLEVLKADDNRIERTIGLEGLPRLRIASLSNNYIDSLDELLFLPTTPSLQLLSLSGNPVARARRYRATVAQLHSSLVALDGAPLLRDADVQNTSAHSGTSMQQRRLRETQLQRNSYAQRSSSNEQADREEREEVKSSAHNSAQGSGVLRTGTASAAPRSAKVVRENRFSLMPVSATTSFSPPPTNAEQHRSKTTQTSLDSSALCVDDSAVMPHAAAAPPPQPTERVSPARATKTPASNTRTKSSAAAVSAKTSSTLTTFNSPSAGGKSSAERKGLTGALASGADLSGDRHVNIPHGVHEVAKQGREQQQQRQQPNQRQTAAAAARANSSVRVPPRGKQIIHRVSSSTVVQSGEAERAEDDHYHHHQSSSGPFSSQSSPSPEEELEEGQEDEMSDDAAEGAFAALPQTLSRLADTLVDDTRATPTAAATMSSAALDHRPTTAASIRLPANASMSNTGGYASLHGTPSSFNAAARSPSFTPHAFASGSGARSRSSGARLLQVSSSSPASLQRSTTSQEVDLATAQLHDSLVAKEQLDKECQTLRKRVKVLEGQLTEARRVISQQLGELSQLRVERDALRLSEAEVSERLEKERRSGKAKTAHHAEEVQTLQAQYERMKTFYESQLADTRRELAAERGRQLRAQQQQQQQQLRESPDHHRSSEKGEDKAEEEAKSEKEAKGMRSTVKEDNSERRKVASTAAEGAKRAPAEEAATPFISVPPAVSQVIVNPDVAVVKKSNSAVPAAVAPTRQAIPVNQQNAIPQESSATDELARQLTSWLYANLNQPSSGAPQRNANPAAVEHGDERSTTEYFRQALEGPALPGQSSEMREDGAEAPASTLEPVITAAAAPDPMTMTAREILESFVASHRKPTSPSSTITATSTAAAVEASTRAAVSSSASKGADNVGPPCAHFDVSEAVVRTHTDAVHEASKSAEQDDVSARLDVAALPPPPPFASLAPPSAAAGSDGKKTNLSDAHADGSEKEEEDHSDGDVDSHAADDRPASEAESRYFTARDAYDDLGDFDNDGEREESGEDDETVVLSAPPGVLVPPAAAAATTRDERVMAAKALLKGMESLFETDA